MATTSVKTKSMEEVKYYKLLEDAAKNKSPKQLMRSQWIQIIIQRIISARQLIQSVGKEKLPAAIKETLNTYDVVERDGNNVLILKATELETNKIIVALEDSYEVVSQAHEVTNHGSVFQMTNCLTQSNFLVNEICYTTIIEVCFQCKNANTIVPPPERPMLYKQKEQMPERLALLDIMDMTLHGSKDFSYLLIYQDYNTKFVQMRPITLPTNMHQEICLELIRLFADMGAPYCVKVLKPLEPMLGEIIDKVNLFLNISIRLVKHGVWDIYVKDLRMDVADALKNWMIRNSNRCWSIGCFFVQWEFNNSKNKLGDIPFAKLYGRMPNTIESPVDNKETPEYIASHEDIPSIMYEKSNMSTQLEELNLHEEADLGIFTESDIKEELQDEIKEEIEEIDQNDTSTVLENDDDDFDLTIIKFDEDFEGMDTSLIKVNTSNEILPEVTEASDVSTAYHRLF